MSTPQQGPPGRAASEFIDLSTLVFVPRTSPEQRAEIAAAEQAHAEQYGFGEEHRAKVKAREERDAYWRRRRQREMLRQLRRLDGHGSRADVVSADRIVAHERCGSERRPRQSHSRRRATGSRSGSDPGSSDEHDAIAKLARIFAAYEHHPLVDLIQARAEERQRAWSSHDAIAAARLTDELARLFAALRTTTCHCPEAIPDEEDSCVKCGRPLARWAVASDEPLPPPVPQKPVYLPVEPLNRALDRVLASWRRTLEDTDREESVVVQLAQRSGISRQTIRNVRERNKRVELDVADRLALAAGIDLNAIYPLELAA